MAARVQDILGAVWRALCALARLIAGALAEAGRREQLPYEREEALFTMAEAAFLRVLHQAVGGRFTIFGKVRLADIVCPRRGMSQRQRYAALNRIISKHVDFVLCEPGGWRVACVVELDDRSHQAVRRRERDAFVDAALLAAGIPVLHIPVRRYYDPSDIQRQIAEVLRADASSGQARHLPA